MTQGSLFRSGNRAPEQLRGALAVAGAGALALIGGVGVAHILAVESVASAKASYREEAAKTPPPAPEPLQFKPVAPVDAVAYNASIPVSDLPNPAARAFLLKAGGDVATRSLECLTSAIYYEAATESVDGQRAVAQVVLNRLRHPAFPNSVCGVVFQGSERSTGCQFTFTCDGSLARAPVRAYWDRAREVAKAALAGYVYKPVGWATHYHTNWVVPYWSSSLTKLANVGTHIFYRWEGGWGTGRAFTDRHAGVEPVLPKMAYIGLGELPEALPEDQKAVLVATELSPAEAAEIGFEGRRIVQRFEPAKREGVAETLARHGTDRPVSSSLRWALTGETVKIDPPASPVAAEGIAKATPSAG